MRKNDIRHSTALKTVAFLLVIAMAWVCIACAVGIAYMLDLDVYTQSESTIRYDKLRDNMEGKAYRMIIELLEDRLVADDFEEVNYTYEIFKDGERIDGDCADSTRYSEEWTFEYLYTKESLSIDSLLFLC